MKTGPKEAFQKIYETFAGEQKQKAWNPVLTEGLKEEGEVDTNRQQNKTPGCMKESF
ncbi:hypothetical protein GLW04_13575 [Halobacillus litoralis]|uniref:Uncharacterized protein n=1 Tax=Halobacillus litoralis TaxID=45668 RepID=A0A845DUZ1_9BACI|nr:hypothetical protein [Halobacillus litoralis]MYL20928.1 hypothetical protein [Halobacillus litoralis]